MILENKITIDELKVGDSLCYWNKGWISFFIRLFTNSKYSHTSIVVATGLVAEAIEKGYVANRIVDSVRNAKQVIVKRPKLNFDKEEFHNEIFRLLNARYEFEGLYYEVVKQIKPYSKWKGDKEAIKDVFCSKANAWLFWKVFKLNDYENWYEVTPRDIANDFKNFETFELILNNK